MPHPRALEHTTKAQAVAEQLRVMIGDGTFREGENLRQRDISALFGVSATPVREAFQRLAVEGYVALDEHRGARVLEVSGRVRDSYRIMGVLIGLAARVACDRVRPEDIEALVELRREYEELCRKGESMDSRYMASQQFSDKVVRIADVAMVGHMLKIVRDAHVDYQSDLGKREADALSTRNLRWMDQTIAAYRVEDADRAEQVARDFADYLEAAVVEILADRWNALLA